MISPNSTRRPGNLVREKPKAASTDTTSVRPVTRTDTTLLFRNQRIRSP